MRRVFHFNLGIGNIVESFQRKFVVPRYLSISADGKCSLQTHVISKELNFSHRSKYSRFAHRKETVPLSFEITMFDVFQSVIYIFCIIDCVWTLFKATQHTVSQKTVYAV